MVRWVQVKRSSGAWRWGWLGCFGLGAGAVLLHCSGTDRTQLIPDEPRVVAGAGGTGSAPDASIDAPVSPPDAGQSDAGTAPTVDAGDAGTALSISGRVVDFYLRALPDIPVTIGQTTVRTGNNGEFSIPGVRPPYDVSLTLSYQRDSAPVRYGYIYQGLTRSDPTLQVHDGGLSRRSSEVLVTVEGADFSDPRRQAIFAFSSADGTFSGSLDAEQTRVAGSWTGPAATTGFAHMLLLLRSDAGVTYESEQVTPLTLRDNEGTSVSFDASAPPPWYFSTPLATLDVDPWSAEPSECSIMAGFRYADGTFLPLIDDRPNTPDRVAYPVPLWFGGNFSVAARKGESAPFVLAHRESAISGRPVYLPMNAPPALGSPADGAVVTAGSAFSWEWSQAYGAQILFVWHMATANGSQGVYVVTTRRQIGLPALAAELIPPGADAVWSVETHVKLIGWDRTNPEPADLDTATGPEGFLDEFTLGHDAPRGPNVADGIFTESERRSLQISP